MRSRATYNKDAPDPSANDMKEPPKHWNSDRFTIRRAQISLRGDMPCCSKLVRGSGRSESAGGMATVNSQTTDVGTLIVDMYDPATKQLVWNGQATKTMGPSNNQQKNEKNLDKSMAKLFKNFPPKA